MLSLLSLQSGPSAAKKILVDVGLWTPSAMPLERGGASLDGKETLEKGQGRDDVEVEVEDGIGVVVEGDGDGVEVIPWSKKALEDATALVAERARRTSVYDGKPPKGRVGSPAPFGRWVTRKIGKGRETKHVFYSRCCI